LNKRSITRRRKRAAAPEQAPREKLIATTLKCLADLGLAGTTLAVIAERAGLSSGLIAHHFGDKVGLLEAAFRSLARRVHAETRARSLRAATPRERVQAVIDANLAPVHFDPDTARAWLAFWAQVPHLPALQRVQIAVQRRMLSNLRCALLPVVGRDRAQSLAAMIASMIDGVWLRAALSNWHEADSSGSRALLADFVDSQLRQGGVEDVVLGKERRRRQATIQTFNPATGELLAVVPVSGPEEVDAAVARASAAQTTWAAMTGTERGRVLRRAADILRSRNDELARLETQDTGKPIQETQVVDVVSGADCLEYFGGLAATIAGEHLDLGPSAFGYTRREPLGVVAGIGAWNYPLQIACWKTAPALACGNAMIFKPAELTPLTAQRLGEALRDAGAPDGIFQVVQGYAETGQLLSRHPGIRKVSVTGAVSTGCAVMRDASDTLKQITLELGGKSPIVVFADADLDSAVAGALLGNFYSAGEVCSNGTRVFVERPVLDRFVEKLVARTRALRIGDPLDPQTQVGTLISRDHMDKVLSYIKAGEAGGARLLTGGRRRTEGALAQGFYVEPAIFDRCGDDMRIVREEIFGPVMCVLAFDDEADVVRRANATEFGLSAGVFTSDLTRAHRVIAQLQAGTCWINHYNITPIELPFGGVKMSGLGRENGRAAIEHYTQLKSVYVAMQPVQSPY
jgi:betaine-aldehyde dehydrogenase